MNKEVKQIIVMRKDLNMRKGKMVAQGAHASLGCITNMFKMKTISYSTIEASFKMGNQSPLYQWLTESFKKICVGVNSLDELYNKLHMVETMIKSKNKYIPFCLITDSGLTEFKKPTITCLGIGPWWSDEIDLITGNLTLL